MLSISVNTISPSALIDLISVEINSYAFLKNVNSTVPFVAAPELCAGAELPEVPATVTVYT